MPLNAKKIRKVMFRIFLFFCVLIAFYFLVKPLAVIDYKIAKLLDENARLQTEKKRFETELSKLQSDIEKSKTYAGWEENARKKLQMVYSGEQLFICKDSQGLDIQPDNEIASINSSGGDKPSIFAKIWDMVLNIFRLDYR